MSGILGKLQVEQDIRGVRIAARSRELTPNCSDDAQIDATVQMLKDDLEACAREMKRLIALNRRGSLFEGWPSSRDDILNA